MSGGEGDECVALTLALSQGERGDEWGRGEKGGRLLKERGDEIYGECLLYILICFPMLYACL